MAALLVIEPRQIMERPEELRPVNSKLFAHLLHDLLCKRRRLTVFALASKLHRALLQCFEIVRLGDGWTAEENNQKYRDASETQLTAATSIRQDEHRNSPTKSSPAQQRVRQARHKAWADFAETLHAPANFAKIVCQPRSWRSLQVRSVRVRHHSIPLILRVSPKSTSAITGCVGFPLGAIEQLFAGSDARCLTLSRCGSAGELLDRGWRILLCKHPNLCGGLVEGTFGPASSLSLSATGRHSISFDFLSRQRGRSACPPTPVRSKPPFPQ